MVVKSVHDSNPLVSQDPGQDNPGAQPRGASFSDTVKRKKLPVGKPANTASSNQQTTPPDSHGPTFVPPNVPSNQHQNNASPQQSDQNSPPLIKHLSSKEYEHIANRITTAGKSPPMRIFSKVDFRDVPNERPKPGLHLSNRSGSPQGNPGAGAPVYGASHQISSERIADEFGLKNAVLFSNGKPKYSFYVMDSKNFDNGEPAVKIGNKIFINEDAYRDWQNGGDGNGLGDWLADHVS